MSLTTQNALFISALLYLFGLIIIIFIVIKHKDKFTGLYNFGYYFLFNFVGIVILNFRETLPQFVTIVFANYIILLAAMFLINGVSIFYKRKTPYKAFLIISIVAISGLSYFTFIDFNVNLRTIIFGAFLFLLHLHVMLVLYKNYKEGNSKINLLSIVISIFLVSLIFRFIIIILSENPETLLNLEYLANIIIVVSGITGASISTGIMSLINNTLIEEARESENIYTNFVNNSPVASMVHASDGEIISISKVFTEITGYTEDDLKTTDDWIRLAYTKDRLKVQSIINNLYKYKDQKNHNTIEILTKDRTTRLWSFSSTYLGVLVDGRSCAMSVAIDITDSNKKQLEVLSLQQKNKKLIDASKIAVDIAKMLVWRHTYGENIDQNHTFVDNEYADLMGWDSNANGMIKAEDFVNSIYRTSENELYFNKYQIMNKKVHSNEIDEYTLNNFRHVNIKTNESIYLEHHTKVEERYEDGKVKYIGGYVINVTESMRIEQKMKFEQEKAQTYLDIIENIIVALDNKGNITLLNNKGCKVLGISEEEAIGIKWVDNFIPKEIRKNIEKVFEDVFDQQAELAKQHENIIVTRTGKEILVNWYNSILHDIDGNVVGVISSGEDVTEKRQYQNNLRELSYKDSLTGLYNRRYYEENLVDIDNEDNYPITIAMGDINGLKLINDAFGHNAGDDLLVSAANAIRESCRDTDLVARIGGDEFVIVMAKTSEIEAEKIIHSIHKKSKKIKIESIELSISFGIKTKYNSFESIQEVYRAAEDLMYREKLLEIPSMRSGAIETILNTLYEKDKNSEIHSRTVSLISEKLAKAYGLSRQDTAEVKTAGLLHDIGKIIIPTSIINKDGKLTNEEYATMKNHSEIGFRILNSTSDMRSISNIVLCHHERWDGLGYPRGIKGEDIPLKARMISIADAFDAMTSERTYKDKISNEDALKEIMKYSGIQFDPNLCKVLEEHYNNIIEKQTS